jgi:HAD superfamily hydrolase (TIGR01509 family)
MTRAIIFDLDGLLVDTETLAMQTVRQTCSQLDIKLEPDEEKNIVGVTSEHFFKELLEKHGSALDLQTVLTHFYEKYELALETDLKPFPGARSLPIDLKSKGFQLALVSGSTTKQVETVLRKLDIKALFDQIITAEDVTESKPSPQGYLLAADKLKVKPAECLVFEDATAGVQAAKAAGMKVIGVRNNGDQDLTQADEVVGNLIAVNLDLNPA